ncbi:MAG: NAD(+)/NADH kinase [Parasporobacterium sp.]|nr:NAD(+)/NADH kinase [Parasporobacterium sp.]
MIKNFLLVTNSVKEEAVEKSQKVIQALENKGLRCTANLFTKENVNGDYLFTNPENVPEDTEAVLVLGGDGTMLHAVKDLIGLNLPFLGINFGTLGYLTEIEADSFDEAVEVLCSGDYHIEDRMLLQGDIYRNGKVIAHDIALNDIVLNRISYVSVIDFDVFVNGEFLNGYAADGIIISSPTGSTGYNLSAGGPVVHPESEILLATPIAAHTLNSRSIVFTADVEIELKIKRKMRERRQQKVVSFDGEKEILLKDGDTVRVKKAAETVKIIKINKLSFVEIIGKKMR